MSRYCWSATRVVRRCGWLVMLALPLGGATAVRAQDPDDREHIEAREEYFWNQRSYPSSVRPYEAMHQARIAAARFSSAPSGTSFSSALAPTSWRPLGPFGFFEAGFGTFGSGAQIDAGRVTSVAPSPSAGGPLFIATASGGVWKTPLLGNAWSPLTDTQCALTTGAVTVDPVNPSIVYAATGEYNVNSSGCGILRSTDAGATWTLTGASSFRLSGGGSAGFNRITIARATAGTVASTVLLAASNVALYRSANGGGSWANVLTGSTASVVEHPAGQGVFFAGNTDNFNAARRGVYKSTDNGATWTQLPAIPNVDPATMRRIELAISPAAPERVYAMIADRTNRKLLGLFVWDDVAQTWTKQAAAGVYTGSGRGDFGAQAEYDFAIAVDPRDANRVYVAGVRAFKSTNGGATFAPMGMEIHCDWHTIVTDPRNPDILYAGTDGGVFVSVDVGDNWTSRNAGLAITQYYPGISLAPDASKVLGGSQDNGTHIYTGSLVWNGFTSGDGGYTAVNYTTPAIAYSESQWSAGASIYRRDATSFTLRNAGIVGTDRGLFIPPLVIDPVTPTTLYFATQRLYRTTDEGKAWTPVSVDLTKGSGTITTIAVAKSDPLTIYVGTTDGQVQVTRDNAVTFTNVSANLPNKYVTRVIVDPADAMHALVTVSGFGTGHVFETKDAGTSWIDISIGLVDAPANSGAFVPGVGIMVGTDVGIFQTADGGATWKAGPAGLPNVIVQDIVYAPASNLVIAATYGRGMFTSTIGAEAAVLRGDVNADGKVDAFDALLIQQAIVGTLPSGTVAYPRGDANCNGAVEASDVILVLRAAVGLANPGACVNTTK